VVTSTDEEHEITKRVLTVSVQEHDIADVRPVFGQDAE